jgi:hypothetical protein
MNTSFSQEALTIFNGLYKNHVVEDLLESSSVNVLHGKYFDHVPMGKVGYLRLKEGRAIVLVTAFGLVVLLHTAGDDYITYECEQQMAECSAWARAGLSVIGSVIDKEEQLTAIINLYKSYLL